MATVLEHFKILPSADSTPEFSLPLVFFDFISYDSPQTFSLVFCEFPNITKSYFLNTLVPDLKSSLSLTLTHFLPFAGNTIHPLKPGDKPIFRYKAGDSVSLTISESNADFDDLTGNHPRACTKFYDFVSNLPPATRSKNSIVCPILAVQVTLFPEQGLCFGFTSSHAMADSSTLVSFIQGWSIINKYLSHGAEFIRDRLTQGNHLPFFDRDTLVTNHDGLFSLFWDKIVELSATPEPKTEELPVDKVRATFVLKKEEIQKLKDFILAKCPGMAHLSSFTIICALVWVCSAKSAGDEVADDHPEYLYFAVDCRRRLNPPLPANYFGNCVGIKSVELKHGDVIKGSSDGFLIVTKHIGEAFKEIAYNDKGVLYGDAHKWVEMIHPDMEQRMFWVAGSPRFDLYAADFGWGKPKKVEEMCIDGGDSISLSKSRNFEGGFEIGLSKTPVQMDAFAIIFNKVLDDLLKECTGVLRFPSKCIMRSRLPSNL